MVLPYRDRVCDFNDYPGIDLLKEKIDDMTTKTPYSFSISMNGKSNNYRIEPVLDGKQTSVTRYKVVNEFGHTVFVGDAKSCNLFVNGSEIKRIAKELI